MTAQEGREPAGLRVAAGHVPPADWEELLAASPDADYTHSAHWQACAAGHRPGARRLCLTVRQGNCLVGGLAAVLTPLRRAAGVLTLRRLDSGTDGTSGGPLVRGDLPEPVRDDVFLALTDAYLAQRPRGVASATFALNPSAESRFGALLACRARWVRHDSPTAMIPLAGGLDEVAARRLTNNKRNERNRGLKRGAEVFATRDPNLIDAYYPLYEAASDLWGIAPTPRGQLRDLLADPADRVFFTCVRLDGKVIGGHLCLHFGSRVFAWNGVSDPTYARTHFPGTLCFWGDLVEACRRGAAWFDLGASGGVQSLTGFKKSFGAEVMQRGYYVADSGAMVALHRARGLVDRLRGGGDRRWHDGRPPVVEGTTS